MRPASVTNPRAAGRGTAAAWAQPPNHAGGCEVPQPPCRGAGVGGTSEIGGANPSGWYREERRAFRRPALPSVPSCGRPLLARTGDGEVAPGPCYPPLGRESAGAARGTEDSVLGTASLCLSSAGRKALGRLRPVAWPSAPGARGTHAGPATTVPRPALPLSPRARPRPARRCTGRHGDIAPDLRGNSISPNSFAFLTLSVVSFPSFVPCIKFRIVKETACFEMWGFFVSVL